MTWPHCSHPKVTLIGYIAPVLCILSISSHTILHILTTDKSRHLPNQSSISFHRDIMMRHSTNYRATPFIFANSMWTSSINFRSKMTKPIFWCWAPSYINQFLGFTWPHNYFFNSGYSLLIGLHQATCLTKSQILNHCGCLNSISTLLWLLSLCFSFGLVFGLPYIVRLSKAQYI